MLAQNADSRAFLECDSESVGSQEPKPKASIGTVRVKEMGVAWGSGEKEKQFKIPGRLEPLN